ncbi:hypothetical protein ACIBCM_04910 [Streptomyces sp. NPDC051018]|uniref:hypothetical protein n=1 Tax=Streptomyces sp. NPDC051018 TaxID=3365639 RepID=UPI00379D96F7
MATALLGTTLFLPFAPQITPAHACLPNRIGVACGLTPGLTLFLGGLATPLLGTPADRAGVRSVLVLLTGVLPAAAAL